MKFGAFKGRFTVVLVAVAACFAVAAPAASAKAPRSPVFWIDLSGTAKQHPRGVFFTANSGPQVRKITWTGWGRNRSVGRGSYLRTSPPPPGGKNPRGPARIVVWKPISCVPEFGTHKGKKIRVYRRAKLLRPVDEGGRKWIDISDYTGWGICR